MTPMEDEIINFYNNFRKKQKTFIKKEKECHEHADSWHERLNFNIDMMLVKENDGINSEQHSIDGL